MLLVGVVVLSLGCAAAPEPAYVPEIVDPIVLTANDVAEPPVVLEKKFPAWPAEYRAGGITGEVVVQGIVGLDGRLRDLEVVRTDHELLAASALEALREWRFQPATLQGRPVEVYHTITQRFRLD